MKIKLNYDDVKKYFNKTPKFNNYNKTNLKFMRNMQYNGGTYRSSSSPLYQQDIIYFSQFTNESLSAFSEGILAKDFQKVNNTHNFTLNKLKNIILPKLKYSVDLSAIQYSTIITKNNYDILVNKINYQYNKIRDFVNINYTEKISNAMNDFLNSLNNTVSFTNVMNNIGFNKIIEIFDKFQELINDKLSSINIGKN